MLTISTTRVASDALGRTAIHQMTHKTPPSFVSDFCKMHSNAANWRDIFGCSPAFYMVLRQTDPCETLVSRTIQNFQPDFKRQAYLSLLEVLLDCGADPLAKDACGTPLMHCAAGRGESEMLNLLLQRSPAFCLDLLDAHESTLLHYAVFSNCAKTTALLINRGCNQSAYDSLRRTPLMLAKELGFVDVAKVFDGPNTSPRYQLYQCKETIEMINRCELPRKNQDMKLDEFCSALLNSPVVGKRFYLPEADQVKTELLNFMTKLSQVCSHHYCPLLTFTPKLRGSAAEGSKVGFPDEYDVLLLMETFARSCEVQDPNHVTDDIHLTNYVRILIATPLAEHVLVEQQLDVISGNYPPYPVLVDELHIKFFEMLQNVLTKQPDMWLQTQFKFVKLIKKTVATTLHITWTGPSYKIFLISVDLVPCIPVCTPQPLRIDWPSRVDLTGCRLLALLRAHPTIIGFAELSYSDFEERIMRSLPPAALDGYVTSKAICSPYVCGAGWNQPAQNYWTFIHSKECSFERNMLGDQAQWTSSVGASVVI